MSITFNYFIKTYLLCDERLCEEPRSEPSVEHRVLPAEYFSLSSTHIITLQSVDTTPQSYSETSASSLFIDTHAAALCIP